MAKSKIEELVKSEENTKVTDLSVEENKGIDIPDVTIDKLIKNEFQMNSVGTNEVEIPVVEAKTSEKTKVEETKSDKIEVVEYNDVDYAGRGFKSLEDAIDFMETPYFKGLGESEKIEYHNWLIKK